MTKKGLALLTTFDKALLNELQKDFPVTEYPFAVVAERLASDEKTVLDHLQALRTNGYLRHVGAFFDSPALGYGGTLIALRVAPAQLAAVASMVNRYNGVTHNYEREGEYNLWFTLLTPSPEEKQAVLEAVGSLPGVERMLDLVAERTYKIRVQFNLK